LGITSSFPFRDEIILEWLGWAHTANRNSSSFAPGFLAISVKWPYIACKTLPNIAILCDKRELYRIICSKERSVNVVARNGIEWIEAFALLY
jgi:hypothetical protein